MSKVKAKAGRSQTATAAEDEVSRDGIQSVNRAFAIMELFDERRPALSVSEIAELTGLNRSTCYRFCQTLKAIGYLEEV